MTNRYAIPRAVTMAVFLGVFSAACDTVPPTTPTTTLLRVASIAPNSAAYNTAATVTIAGSGFVEGATVTIGGVPAAVLSRGSGTITALTAARDAGVGDVVVTNPGNGTSVTLSNAFTWHDLTVTRLSAPAGFPSDEISVFGTGFRPGLQVLVDGQSVGPVTPNTAGTTFSFSLPEHQAGDVPVVISNPDGRSVTASEVFHYYAATLSASAAEVSAGGSISVTWNVPAGQEGGFIGLYRVGESHYSYLWLFDPKEPTGTVTLTAPAQPGSYHFRYRINHDWDYNLTRVGGAFIVVPPINW